MEQGTENLTKFVEEYKTYFTQLRRDLFITGIIFAIGAIIGLFSSQAIITFILSIYNFKGVTIMTTSPYQYVDVTLTTSFLCGILLALPYAFFRLFIFFKPALTKKESTLLTRFLPVSIILFVIGFSFGTWIIQLIISFYSSTWVGANVNTLWDIQHFFSQVIFMSILTGLIFQIPIVVTLLIRLNIVKKQIFIAKRRFIYVFLLGLAVLLPPTDVFSLIMLTLPLFFLFEFGLLLNRRV